MTRDDDYDFVAERWIFDIKGLCGIIFSVYDKILFILLGYLRPALRRVKCLAALPRVAPASFGIIGDQRRRADS